MSLLGRSTLRVASALRVSSMASTSVSVPRFTCNNLRVQGEQPKRMVANWMPLSVKKSWFSMTGHNQFGLYTDDMYIEEGDVVEALRRLPLPQQDERAFRIQRALQCAVMHTVLPKEEWVSYEEDQTKGFYLKPYLDEVIKEREEREAWDKL